MPIEHIVKCWPDYYDAIERGDKPFDVRRDDRGYQKGDTLVLQRTQPRDKFTVDYDGYGKAKHELRRKITYILTGGQFGLEPGYVVLGLEMPASRGALNEAAFAMTQEHTKQASAPAGGINWTKIAEVGFAAARGHG